MWRIFISFITLTGLNALIHDWDKKVNGCHKDYYFGTVGHYNITRANFQEALNTQDPIVMMVSSSQCRECCLQEPVLQQYISEIFENPSMNSGIKVSVGRLDLSKDGWFMSDYKINTVPEYFLLYKGKIHIIPNKSNGRFVMTYIRRSIQPITRIETVDSLVEYIQGKAAVDDYFIPKRYLLVNTDVNSLQKMHNWATNIRWRMDVGVAMIQDASLLKTALDTGKLSNTTLKQIQKYNLELPSALFFYQETKNSEISIISHTGLKDLTRFGRWFVETSHQPVEELTKKNVNSIYELKKMVVQIFIATKNKEEVNRLKTMLTEFVPELGFYFVFTLVNFRENKRAAMSFGLGDCTDVCLAVDRNDPHDAENLQSIEQDVKFYRMGPEVKLTQEVVKKFLLRIVEGAVPLGHSETSHLPVAKLKAFRSHFDTYEFVDKEFYREAIMKNNRDYIMIIVNSLADMDTEHLKNQVEIVKKFLKKAPEMPLIVFNDAGVYDLFEGRNLPLLTAFIVVNETKSSGRPLKRLETTFNAAEAILAFLKLKRFKLSKTIGFDDEEIRNGIDYDFIFEGKTFR